MASTGHFVNVAVAEESSYGSLSSGVPDASGLTYKVLDAYATLRTLSSESPVDDDAGTRDGSWRRPPRPNAAYDTSNSRWRQRMEGTFTIEGAVDPIGSGSGITDYDDHPLGIMLGTLFAKLADPASATENVAGSSGANVLTATTAGLYTEGAIIGHTDAAKFRFAQVTDKSGNDITHSPALDASGLSAAEAVRLYRTYYAPAPGQAADVVSFATRFDSAGARFYAVGCVVESVTFSETDGMQLRYSATVRSPCIYSDHSSAALNPIDYAGEIGAHRYQCPVVYSDAVAGTSAPYTLGRSDLNPRPGSVQVTVTATLDQLGYAGEGIPYKLTPTALDFELTMVVDEPPSALANAFEARQQFTFYAGYGPQTGGTGVVFFIPRGHLMQSAANRDSPEGQAVQQTITVRPGRPFAVNDASNVAKSPFLIGLGL